MGGYAEGSIAFWDFTKEIQSPHFILQTDLRHSNLEENKFNVVIGPSSRGKMFATCRKSEKCIWSYELNYSL